MTQSSTKTTPKPQTLRSLEALVLDCDGVLTNGDIVYDDQGRRLLSFNARDGLGLGMLCRRLKVAVLSRRPTDIAELRHRSMGLAAFVGSCANKGQGLKDLCETLQVDPSRTAFMGRRPRRSVCLCGVRPAHCRRRCGARSLRRAATWITRDFRGRGAVREVCESILERGANGEDMVRGFTHGEL
ncbi:MAG: hypothetical protein R3C68_15925 [Myxococcota bacterium]